MPTVDDLVISLTIKETGNLGKLKKSLESLTGAKGSGLKGIVPSFMYLKRDLVDLKKSSQWIKKRLTFLMPTVIPKGTEALKESARIAHALIDRTRETLIDKMITKDRNALLGMMEAQGINTETELREFLDDKLTEYQGRLEGVMKGFVGGEKGQRLVVRIDRLIAAQDFAGGYAKKLLEDIENSIAEFNREMAQLLQSRGMSVSPEFYIYRPLLEKLTESIKSAVSRGDPYVGLQDFMKYIGLESEEAKATLKEINPLLFLSKNTMDFLNQSAKQLKLQLTPEMFTPSEVEKSDVLKTIAAGMAWVWFKQKGKVEAGGFPTGFREQLTKIMDTLFAGNFSKIKGLWEHRKIDMAMFGGEIEDLQELFGVRLGKLIHDNPMHFIEFKKILAKGNVEQFKQYMDFYGKKNVSAVASLIRSSFKDILPNIVTKTMNVLQELQKSGVISKMTSEELDEIKNVFEKKMTSEFMISSIKQMMEEVKSIIPSEIYNKLRETDEWKGVIDDLTNEELREGVVKSFNEAIKKLEEGIAMNPAILRALKMLSQAIGMGAANVSEVGSDL